MIDVLFCVQDFNLLIVYRIIIVIVLLLQNIFKMETGFLRVDFCNLLITWLRNFIDFLK